MRFFIPGMHRMNRRQERDLWDWAEMAISVLSGVAVPLILFYFGYHFRQDQQAVRNTDRVRNSIDLLSSDDWRERVMGVRLMGYYCGAERQYPDSLIASLMRTMRTDPNPNVHRETNKLFGMKISATDPCHIEAPPPDSGRGDGPGGTPQLYVHIQERDQADRAHRITRALRALPEDSIHVVSTERLETGPLRSELRYFDPRQRSVARAITRWAEQAATVDLAIRDFSTHYDTIPNHFELWLAP